MNFTPIALLLGTAGLCSCGTEQGPPQLGVLLESLTWIEAEAVLTPDTIVVIPIGAAAKEHGPHLTLENDFLIAEYHKRRMLESADVVIAPTVNYHYYPAFSEYPGSTSLRLETARDLIVDIVRGLSAFGPKRFYALNTGVSTNSALEPAAAMLREEGILLHYTDLREFRALESEIREQEGGTHADEIETSMMLYIAPETVDMSKAVEDYDPRPLPGLTRDPNKASTYSATGIWGNPTLATLAKGEFVVEGMLRGHLLDIEKLRLADLPQAPR